MTSSPIPPSATHEPTVGHDAAEHLDPLIVAAFLDGGLDHVARRRAMQHLDACALCRAEIGDVQRLLRPAHTRPWWWGGVAAAAAALVIWLAPNALTRANGDASFGGASPAVTDAIDRERAALAAPEIDAPLDIVSDSLIPATGDIQLVWRAAAPGASYDLLVQDENGAVLYAITTSDTTQRVPRARLATRAPMYWRVHAQLLDGRERSTGAQRLRPLSNER